uniref:Uncharacterized protein n=1 Tax=Romanomermis culicivorax TaxID=13658 RepID=A0A915HNF9_ROMCU
MTKPQPTSDQEIDMEDWIFPSEAKGLRPRMNEPDDQVEKIIPKWEDRFSEDGRESNLKE